MHRILIGKRDSLSRWLIQVIFNRSLYIIQFPLIYYAYIQNQPQYQGSEHAKPCVLWHCLRTSPSYGFYCLHKGNMVFWISILYESNGFYIPEFLILHGEFLILSIHCWSWQSLRSVFYQVAFWWMLSWNIWVYRQTYIYWAVLNSGIDSGV